MSIDVIESFIPSFQTSPFQFDDLTAEAAPKLTLSIPAYPAFLELFLNVVIVGLLMGMFEMLHKDFAAVE